MRSKKRMFVVTLLIGLILIAGSVVPSMVQGQAKEPVKIGCLTPLSPPGDPASGKRIVWGAELGIKYVNEVMGGVLGGRPVQLAVEDDQGVPAEGVAGYRRLVTKDGVAAVVGQFHSSVCLAVNEVAKELGVPLFSTGASSAKITESRYPTIFSIMGLTPPRAEFFMDFAKKTGFKRVAVMAEDTDYGTDFDKWLKEYGKKEGIEVKGIIFPRTAVDLTPSLLIMKAWNPDLLINVGVGPNAYLLTKQAYDVGLFPKVPMLATFDFPTRKEYWDALGDKGNYILYMTYYKPGMPASASGNWMISKYLELYKEQPTFYAINVFGEVLIIAQAINFAKSANPKDVLTALSTRTFTDWAGTVKFEELPGMRWHNVSPPFFILQMTKVRQPVEESHTVWPLNLGGDGKFQTP
ncbi:MAG TPA: ABC transporter substrate-binding protein [Thermodesulfobacteriota bacterium]|nr:ABC transporter substrate-binding protein [Thermodesulfobacteriota bacterium]